MGFFQSLKDDLSEAVDGLVGDVSLEEDDSLDDVDMDSLLKELGELDTDENSKPGLRKEDAEETTAEPVDETAAVGTGLVGGDAFEQELAKMLAELPADDGQIPGQAENAESEDENIDEELAALLDSLPSDVFDDETAAAGDEVYGETDGENADETAASEEISEDTTEEGIAVSEDAGEAAEEETAAIEEIIKDIKEETAASEEINEAAAEEAAASEEVSEAAAEETAASEEINEGAGTGEETAGAEDIEDLDNIEDDIPADESADEEDYTPATAEEIAEFEASSEVGQEDTEDPFAADDPDKLLAELAALQADISEKDETEAAKAETPDTAAAEAVEKTEPAAAAEEIQNAGAGAAEEVPAAAAETAQVAAIEGGEQMTISQMMEIAEDSSEVIKQAEAMAEAAMIADLEEAAEEAQEAGEEKKTDNKSSKKGRKKSVKNEKTEEIIKRVSDETAVFAEGMSIKGNVESDGSLELCGSIEGDIDIAGKLKVSGIIKGNTTAGELYADGAEINGDICCSGSVKVGQSTIIIGNITGSSAVIAGAVKGDIDVHGPVILDSVAIVMGDIRSQSLQISNGAAVQGMCTQIYSPITPSDFFEGFDKK